MTVVRDDTNELVSPETGRISRRIFTDEEIFEDEMRNIFGRAWLFLCHESQIPKRGDFFEAPMGRDNVLVVRQRDGSIRAFLNTCTHRGNAVCRAEEGNTRAFMCTYHGWTFGLDGELLGVPGADRYYKGDIDKSQLGLRKVAQLDTYKGFVFGTFDATAPLLLDYLGTTGRLSLDLIAERGEDMEMVPGVQKFVVDCNWKLTMDNVPDFYHPQITHMSATASGFFDGVGAPQTPDEAFEAFLAGDPLEDSDGVQTPDGRDVTFQDDEFLSFVGDNIVVLGEYGHFIGGPRVSDPPDFRAAWRSRPGVAEILGPVGMQVDGHPNIFPTMWITNRQVSLRVPRSATRTEIWWFSFVPKAAEEFERKMSLMMSNHIFGPAGILEQEDGENWVQGTMQAHGIESSKIPQTLQMNVGRGEVLREHGLARIEGVTNEHAQLWAYASWAQWMSGCDWDQLRANTTPGAVL